MFFYIDISIKFSQRGESNIRRKLLNNKGFTTIEIIAYVAVAAIIVSIAIPMYNDAFAIRSTKVSNNFNSADTVIIE